MKNIISALTGKKAMYTVLIIVTAGMVLDIAASFRQGTSVDFAPLTAIYASIAVWAAELESKKNAIKDSSSN